MDYIVKVTHNAPTLKQFAEWGVKEAYPEFYINIAFHKDGKEELTFRIKIIGHYYCCGSRNFEEVEMIFDTYKVNNGMSKKEIGELLEDSNIEDILKDSIKGSMIPNDPSGIFELIWDRFQ